MTKTSIPKTLANYHGRSINIALIDNDAVTLEVAFSGFVEKLLDS